MANTTRPALTACCPRTPPCCPTAPPRADTSSSSVSNLLGWQTNKQTNKQTFPQLYFISLSLSKHEPARWNRPSWRPSRSRPSVCSSLRNTTSQAQVGPPLGLLVRPSRTRRCAVLFTLFLALSFQICAQTTGEALKLRQRTQRPLQIPRSEAQNMTGQTSHSAAYHRIFVLRCGSSLLLDLRKKNRSVLSF